MYNHTPASTSNFTSSTCETSGNSSTSSSTFNSTGFNCAATSNKTCRTNNSHGFGSSIAFGDQSILDDPGRFPRNIFVLSGQLQSNNGSKSDTSKSEGWNTCSEPSTNTLKTEKRSIFGTPVVSESTFTTNSANTAGSFSGCSNAPETIYGVMTTSFTSGHPTASGLFGGSATGSTFGQTNASGQIFGVKTTGSTSSYTNSLGLSGSKATGSTFGHTNSSGSVFVNSNRSTSGHTNASGLFGSNSTGSTFGQTNSSGSIFSGNGNRSTSGHTNASGVFGRFGSNAAGSTLGHTNDSGSIFGGNATSASKLFGSIATESTFGHNTSGSTFGDNAIGSTSGRTNASGLLGSNATGPSFGHTNASGNSFGINATGSTCRHNNASGLLGSNATGPSFGHTNATGSTSGHNNASGLFGNNPTRSTFGQTNTSKPIFGVNATGSFGSSYVSGSTFEKLDKPRSIFGNTSISYNSPEHQTKLTNDVLYPERKFDHKAKRHLLESSRSTTWNFVYGFPNTWNFDSNSFKEDRNKRIVDSSSLNCCSEEPRSQESSTSGSENCVTNGNGVKVSVSFSENGKEIPSSEKGGGAQIKFNAVDGSDTMVKSGACINVHTKINVITAMKEFENESIEELRVKDYLKGYKESPSKDQQKQPAFEAKEKEFKFGFDPYTKSNVPDTGNKYLGTSGYYFAKPQENKSENSRPFRFKFGQASELEPKSVFPQWGPLQGGQSIFNSDHGSSSNNPTNSASCHLCNSVMKNVKDNLFNSNSTFNNLNHSAGKGPLFGTNANVPSCNTFSGFGWKPDNQNKGGFSFERENEGNSLFNGSNSTKVKEEVRKQVKAMFGDVKEYIDSSMHYLVHGIIGGKDERITELEGIVRNLKVENDLLKSNKHPSQSDGSHSTNKLALMENQEMKNLMESFNRLKLDVFDVKSAISKLGVSRSNRRDAVKDSVVGHSKSNLPYKMITKDALIGYYKSFSDVPDSIKKKLGPDFDIAQGLPIIPSQLIPFSDYDSENSEKDLKILGTKENASEEDSEEEIILGKGKNVCHKIIARNSNLDEVNENKSEVDFEDYESIGDESTLNQDFKEKNSETRINFENKEKKNFKGLGNEWVDVEIKSKSELKPCEDENQRDTSSEEDRNKRVPPNIESYFGLSDTLKSIQEDIKVLKSTMMNFTAKEENTKSSECSWEEVWD